MALMKRSEASASYTENSPTILLAVPINVKRNFKCLTKLSNIMVLREYARKIISHYILKQQMFVALIVFTSLHEDIFYSAKMQAAAATKIMFGVNVHPIQGGIYSNQAAAMKAMTYVGLKGYRMDLDTSSTSRSLLTTAFRDAPVGATVLPLLDLVPDASVTESENYQAAYALVEPLVANFRSVTFWEVGNEIDNWIGVTGDGSTIEQYNLTNYIAARGFFSGMIAAVHAANPKALAIINDAGWCHYGMMNQLWADGVRWDVTAIHWYGNMGNVIDAACGPNERSNVLAIHAAFGKPIWFTEFNSNAGGDAANHMAKWAPPFMTQISDLALQYNIQAAFIYELYSFENDGNGYLGIFSSTGAVTATSDAIKSWISTYSNGTIP